MVPAPESDRTRPYPLCLRRQVSVPCVACLVLGADDDPAQNKVYVGVSAKDVSMH